jgi:hypothetical protein
MHASVRTPHPSCPSQRLLGCVLVPLSIERSMRVLLHTGLSMRNYKITRIVFSRQPHHPRVRAFKYARPTSSTRTFVLPQDMEAACPMLCKVTHTKLHGRARASFHTLEEVRSRYYTQRQPFCDIDIRAWRR